jgi:hypothetical protein
MTHIFKLQFQFADLFVYQINLDDQTIKAQTREKDTGKALSGLGTDKYTVHDGKIIFPLGNMPLDLAKYIQKTLQ